MVPQNEQVMKKTLSTLCLIACSGCVKENVDRDLEAHRITHGDAIERMRRASGSRDYTGKLSWAQAVKRAEAENLGFLQSKEFIRKAHLADRKTWFTLAPRLFAYAHLSKSISEIANISSDDLSLSIIANVVIPNPVQFYAQLYTNRLEVLRAEWQHEVMRRNLHVELYRVFQQASDIKEKERELAKISSVSYHDLEGIASKMLTLKSKQHSLGSEFEGLRVNLNRILNTPGKNWKLTGKLPDISYEGKVDQLSLKNGFGKLGLMLQTIQIELSTLMIWNVKVGRFPNFNIGVSTPPLYQFTGGDLTTYESDKMRLFTGFSKGIDFEDPLDRELLKNTEMRVEHTRKMLLLTTEREASSLYLLKRNYRRVLKSKRQTEALLRRERALIHQAEGADGIINRLKKQQGLKQKLRMQKRYLTQLDLQFLQWDEQYWKKY